MNNSNKSFALYLIIVAASLWPLILMSAYNEDFSFHVSVAWSIILISVSVIHFFRGNIFKDYGVIKSWHFNLISINSSIMLIAISFDRCRIISYETSVIAVLVSIFMMNVTLLFVVVSYLTSFKK